MHQFIQSKNIDDFLETQDRNSDDYHALFALFPHARFNRQAFIHAIRPLNHSTYSEHAATQDLIKHWTGTKEEPVHAICKDCNQPISAFSLFSHATTHYITCNVCDFSPEPDTLCERTQHMMNHQLFCYDTCQYCHLYLPIKHKESHHTSCKKKRVICTECDQLFTIEEHILHITHDAIFQMKKTHNFITCPICSAHVMGEEYATHYRVLHNDLEQSCPYCTQIFFNGITLFTHVTEQHNDDLKELLTYSNEKNSTQDHPYSKNNLLTVIHTYKKIKQPDHLKRINALQKTTHQKIPLQATKKKLQDKMADLCVREHQQEQIENFKKQAINVKEKIHELEEYVKYLEHMIYCSSSTTYDGTTLWLIKNVTQRYQDAQHNKKTYFDSHQFYTHKFGYHMCLRAYLNGNNDSSRGTHFSIFLIVIPGTYDCTLHWPVHFKVSFTLQDQSNSRIKKHITRILTPDADALPIQQPTSATHYCLGFSKFASINVLSDTQYIKDNTLFLQCVVTKDVLSTSNPIYVPSNSRATISETQENIQLLPLLHFQ